MVLTAARTSEVIKATWSEFDLEGRTWTVPASRMKSQREHRVPLAPRALEILKAARKISDGSDYVFPGLRAGQPLSNMVFIATLKRMKRTDVTPHGFRSSFRDWSEERTNHPRSVTEAALAHVVRDKTEAAYRRTDLFERRRKLMAAWAAFCTETAGRVVRIRA
jgi:integrase